MILGLHDRLSYFRRCYKHTIVLLRVIIAISFTPHALPGSHCSIVSVGVGGAVINEKQYNCS